MKKQTPIELLALTISVGVFIGAIWFWSGQIQEVLDVLEMAYG